MNFKSVINDVCCDKRIKNGTLDLSDPNHVFVLQEYLETVGLSIDEIVDKTAKLFEAGRFPERQAYNKDGILVTFPTKEYKDRAVRKGTHFVENPKKSQSNIFMEPTPDVDQPQDDLDGSVTVDSELEKGERETKKDTYISRSPIEKVVDAQSVQSILTGETPLVNYSVDEAKHYGFYNKGTIWYDGDGNVIGEQYYDEHDKKSLIKLNKEVSLSTITSKAFKKIDVIDKKFLEILQMLKFGSLSGKSDETFKTDVYETMPLLVLYGIDDLQNAKNLGGDSVPRAVEFLQKIGNIKSTLDSIKNEKIKNENLKIYDAVIKALYELGGKNGPSLKDITSKTPNEFIHRSIEDFYKIAKKYDERFAGSEVGKKNTADIVIIYGGTKKDVFEALNEGLVENAGESVVKIKDKDIYFALVSLKAMSGRVGRVLTQLRDYLDQEVEVQPSAEYQKLVKENVLNEGFFSTVKNTFDKFIDKYKEISDSIKQKYRGMIEDFSKLTGNFADKIKKDLFETLNIEVKKIQNDSFREFKKLEDDISKEVSNVNEKKSECGADSAALTTSLSKNLSDYEKLLGATNTDTTLIEKIIQTSQNPTVSKFFIFDLNPEQLQIIKNIKQNIKSVIRSIISSKPTCVPRDQLMPVLAYRSNMISLQYIDLIMKRVLQDTNLSDPNKIQTEFLNLATVLSTEAIFGGNVSLPLIKFNGLKLERLGYKNEYKIKVPETIPDLKLGKLTIKIEPTENAYLIIYLYLFSGIKTEDDKVTPVYVVYEMRSDSGSSFTFKVEGQKYVDKI